VAEGLGQDTVMHRFVFACLVFVLVAQGAEGQSVSSEQDYASDTAQNNKVFRIVVIGDSIAWGAGLSEDKKYYSLVRDWLASERSIPIGSIDVQVLAHTGATLFTENDDPIRLSDLSSGNPTIAQQADKVSDPFNVDLVLVSGGINDVGVDNIIKLDHLENPTDLWNNVKSWWGKGTYSIEDIRDRSRNLEDPMHDLLTGLLNECPNAKIVVTGYYPIVSNKSKGLTDTIEALYPESQQVNDYQRMDEPHQRDQLRDKSNVFYDESTESLRAAVADSNSDSGDNRVAFAQIEFSPENCYGADQSLLWKIGNFGGQIKTDDNRFDTRMSILNDLGWVCACEQCPTSPDAEIAQNVDCDLYRRNKFVAVGHPNEEGAIKYKDSIIETIGNTWPNWPDWQNPTVLAFDVLPRSMTSGESLEITYTISDNDGSGLKQAELWRKDESTDWQEIKTDTLADENDPISGSFTDSPSSPGKYWYGLHVVDNAGNWNDEKNSSNSNNQPSVDGPIEVDVTEAQSVQEREESVPVNMTLYVHEGSADGPFISDATIEGQDGSGNGFRQNTDSNGYVTLEGDPGTWSFSASADGYDTNSWDQEITETDTKDAYLMKSAAPATQGSESSVVGKWAFHFIRTSWESSSEKVTRDPGSKDEWDSMIQFHRDGTFIESTSYTTFTGEWIQNGDSIRLQDSQEFRDSSGNYASVSEASQSRDGIIDENTMSGSGSVLTHNTVTGDESYSAEISETYSWSASRVGEMEKNEKTKKTSENAYKLFLTLMKLDDDPRKNEKEAWTVFNQALDASPDDVVASDLLSVMYSIFERQGKYEEALEACEKAIEKNPNSPCLWYSKSKALKALGRDSEASAADERGEILFERVHPGQKYPGNCAV
jgi:hypothetical protein